MTLTANQTPWVERTKVISAENTYTDPLNVTGTGVVRVEDTSSMSMTLVLQSSDDDGSTWITESGTMTAAGTREFDGLGLAWRVGCPTGSYTSGTSTVGLRRERG